jgi:hypothetical protein
LLISLLSTNAISQVVNELNLHSADLSASQRAIARWDADKSATEWRHLDFFDSAEGVTGATR